MDPVYKKWHFFLQASLKSNYKNYLSTEQLGFLVGVTKGMTISWSRHRSTARGMLLLTPTPRWKLSVSLIVCLSLYECVMYGNIYVCVSVFVFSLHSAIPGFVKRLAQPLHLSFLSLKYIFGHFSPWDSLFRTIFIPIHKNRGKKQMLSCSPQ